MVQLNPRKMANIFMTGAAVMLMYKIYTFLTKCVARSSVFWSQKDTEDMCFDCVCEYLEHAHRWLRWFILCSEKLLPAPRHRKIQQGFKQALTTSPHKSHYSA